MEYGQRYMGVSVYLPYDIDVWYFEVVVLNVGGVDLRISVGLVVVS